MMASRDHALNTCGPTPQPHADLWCDWCDRPASADDFNDATASFICPACLERMAEDQIGAPS